ncbi:Atp-binding protein, partial [Globisporangium polare]
MTDSSTPNTPIGSESGKALMAQGPEAFHDLIATKVEKALGRALPQMELRFSNLSVSADVVVTEEDDSKSELPSIVNTIKGAFVSRKKNTVRKEILKNVSGVFKPGTITLILGQPSSGKSSLMKMLSGRFPMTKNLTIEGTMTYNGQTQEKIKKTLPQFVAYTTQRDNHYPVLTVKETLEFAHTFSGGKLPQRVEDTMTKGTPEENAEALQVARSMYEHYPEIIIEQLGLQNCQDTVVGDAMTRGVSGGERKRVTTGEMEFGMKYVTLMDEISTGLDSAATFDIINTQRSVAKKLRKTVVIALLQPAPEVFALFDDIMIMNDGEVMYHGPREQVVGYFESLGFVCPPERDVADFLLDLGTKQQHKYEVASPQNRRKHPRLPSEFAEIFRQSSIHHQMLSELEAPHDPQLLDDVTAHMNPMPEFHQTFWEGTATLFKRQMFVQLRNKAFIFGRILMVFVMGLLNATVFYQFDPTKVQVVMGIIFQSALFLSMGQASQVPTYVAARDIFYKQRGANFFRTSSFVLANSVSQIPLGMMETLLFGSLVYWMCGFATKFVEFVLFLTILLLTNLAFGAWFFFISSVAKNGNIAQPMAMISILFFILFSGFIVTKNQIPDYFIWIYWISPVTWSILGLAVNQYRSSEFNVCESDGIDYCTQFNGQQMGEYFLNLFGVPSDKSWVYVAIFYLLGLYLAFLVMAFFALEYLRYEAPENVTLTKTEDAEDGYMIVETPKNSGSSSGSSSTKDIVLLEVDPTNHNFTPVTLAFTDLWYTVPLPSNPKETIDLLKG